MSKIRLQRYDKHNAVALLHFDSSITKDECGNTWSAVGSPTLSSDYHKFGSKSIFVNNENYIQSTDSFTVGGSDLTIEAWIYNLGGQATFFSFGTADSGLCLCTGSRSGIVLEAIIGTSRLAIVNLNLYGYDYVDILPIAKARGFCYQQYWL